MNSAFWFQFTMQAGIPGTFLLWLFADDAFQALRSRLNRSSKAGPAKATAVRRGSR